MELPDLGSLGRSRSETAEEVRRVPGSAFYANDCTASLDPGGNLTVEFWFQNNEGAHDPVTVSMPVEVYMQLVGISDQVLAGHAQMLAAKIARIKEVGGGAQGANGDGPSDLDEARRMREQG